MRAWSVPAAKPVRGIAPAQYLRIRAISSSGLSVSASTSMSMKKRMTLTLARGSHYAAIRS
jgi:hypothetical protein